MHKKLLSNLSYNDQIKAAVVNPNKMNMLRNIFDKFINNRIILCCDDIWCLHYVFHKFEKTHNVIGPICMKTTTDMREKFVAKFLQEDNIGKILMISRTGDEGIDIPSATKMVQICTPWGSRRQHAQRIGRVQRPKKSMRYVKLYRL